MANNNKRLYGGSYDKEINDTYRQIANRPAFKYDVDGDALYKQYRDRYTQNAKMAMKDTMGQAAALTGGYGSSYGQAVGHQAYDRQMLGLTDKIPELQQNAYAMWQDQGNAMRDRFNLLNSMAAAEQATAQQDYDRAWNEDERAYNRAWNEDERTYNRNQTAYSLMAQLISTTGYQPTADELAAAGMNSAQANYLRQMWIASNPGAAYVNGQLSSSDYFKLTGQYPPDVAAAQAAAAGAGGGGVPYTPPAGSGSELTQEKVMDIVAQGGTAAETMAYINDQYPDADKTAAKNWINNAIYIRGHGGITNKMRGNGG